MVPVDITDVTVDTVVWRLLGLVKQGGVDSIRLQHCLLRFGVARFGLQQIFREFGDWMGNSHPPWAAYRALILGHLIGINKFPGFRPVGGRGDLVADSG